MITTQHKIELPNIEGIHVRAFDMKTDLPALVNLLNIVSEFEKSDDYSSVDEVRNIYEHAVNCDFVRDFIVIEVNDKLVGFQRVSWRDLPLENSIIYVMTGSVHPDWLNQGIGTVMGDWAESRLQEISQTHDNDKKKFLISSARESAEHRLKFLENRHFAPERYFYEMERDDLSDIPPVNLPDGIQLKQPVNETDWRKAYNCLNEAFKDHWGYAAETEEDFQRAIHNPHLRPTLTQLAYDGDDVVGTLIVYFNEEANQKTNKLEAWTEDISVLKPYRGQGIARAMIYAALQAVKQAGMKSAMLGVDTQNPSGALKLYEDCGYKPVRTSISYRKPL